MDSGKLIVVHNFISANDIENINQHLAGVCLSEIEYENDSYVKNKLSSHYKKSKRKINFPSRCVLRHDNNLVYELLDKFVPSIKFEVEKSFGLSVLPENPYSITAYLVGDEFPEHHDGNPKREISSILYLNDDFDGGEISFPNQGVRLKPKSGMLIIFPATTEFAHSVGKVKSGSRYIIPLFWSINHTK